MPLAGSGDVLGEAILSAQDAAAAAFVASHPTPLSDADRRALRHEMAKALGRAVIAHLTTTAGTAAVTVPGAQAGVSILPGNLI
jgi:hypothetical protein